MGYIWIRVEYVSKRDTCIQMYSNVSRENGPLPRENGTLPPRRGGEEEEEDGRRRGRRTWRRTRID